MTDKKSTTDHREPPSPSRQTEADIDAQSGNSVAQWRVLQNLPDALPACISFLGTDRKYRYVNKQYEVWFGRKLDEIVGKHPWDFMGHEAYKRIKPQLDLAFDGKQTIHETSIPKPGGGTRYILSTLVPVRSSKGFVEGICVTSQDISERRKLEGRLSDSEDRFEGILNAMADWVWEVDKDGVYTYCSEKVYDVLGFSPEEMVGRTPFDFMPPDEASRVAAQFKESCQNKTAIVNLENWNTHKDGHDVCLLTNGIPILDEQGALAGYRGVDHDITSRKRTEEALKASEEKYRTIYEHLQDIYYETLLDGTILEISPSADNVSHYTREELIGSSLWDLYSAREDRELLLTILQQQGKVTDYEVRLVDKDGTIIPFAITAKLHIDEDGKPIKICGTMRDITVRKKMEEELNKHSKKLSERLKELNCLYSISKILSEADLPLDKKLQNSVDLIPEGWQNPAHTCARIKVASLSYTSKDFLETSNILFSPIPSGSQSSDTLEVFVTDKMCENSNEPFIREEKHLINEIATRVGELVKRKRVEMELKKAREKAEAANKLKGEFLANITHELKTPMNSILGYTELLIDGVDGPLNKEQEISLSKVEKHARSLLHLIDEVLDLTEMEAHRSELSAEAFSLRGMFAEQIHVMHEKAIAKALDLKWTFETDIPDMLIGDHVRLGKVVQNVVKNAIKFTDRGFIKVCVAHDWESENQIQLHFTVSDTGEGIDAEKQKIIFEPFTQSNGTLTRPHQGAGLGLAISAHYVEMMGGKIWVESEQGHGSTFHFTVKCWV